MLGLGPGQCRSRGIRVRALAVAERFGCPGFRFDPLSCRLLGLALGLRARIGFFDRARLDRGALARGRVSALLGFEPRLREGVRFGFGSRAYFGLRFGFPLRRVTFLRCFRGLSVSFGTRFRSRFGCAIVFEAGRGLLLKIGFSALARPRRLDGFLLRRGARLGRFDGAYFRRGARLGDRFRGGFRFDPDCRLAFELGFGRSAFAFGFERFLLGCGTRFRSFGCASFSSSAGLRDRFRGAVRFSASGGLLLRLRFRGEAGVRGFDGLLICCGTPVRRVLRFELGFLTCLRFFDGARVGGDAALGTHLGLSFHFGALKREARCVAIGFGTGGRLRCARAFGCFARTRRGQRAALAFWRQTRGRFFGMRNGESVNGSPGAQVFAFILRARIVRVALTLALSSY